MPGKLPGVRVKDSVYERTLKSLASNIDAAEVGLRVRSKAGDLSSISTSIAALDSEVEAIDARLATRLQNMDMKMMELEARRDVLDAQEAEASAGSLDVSGVLQVQTAHCTAMASEIDRAESMLVTMHQQEAALLHQASLQDIECEVRLSRNCRLLESNACIFWR